MGCCGYVHVTMSLHRYLCEKLYSCLQPLSKTGVSSGVRLRTAKVSRTRRALDQVQLQGEDRLIEIRVGSRNPPLGACAVPAAPVLSAQATAGAPPTGSGSGGLKLAPAGLPSPTTNQPLSPGAISDVLSLQFPIFFLMHPALVYFSQASQIYTYCGSRTLAANHRRCPDCNSGTLRDGTATLATFTEILGGPQWRAEAG